MGHLVASRKLNVFTIKAFAWLLFYQHIDFFCCFIYIQGAKLFKLTSLIFSKLHLIWKVYRNYRLLNLTKSLNAAWISSSISGSGSHSSSGSDTSLQTISCSPFPNRNLYTYVRYSSVECMFAAKKSFSSDVNFDPSAL